MITKETKTLAILHTAVFLAGWTGILGRLISLGGLPPYLRFYPGAAITPTGNDILWIVLLGSVFTVLPFLFQLQAMRSLSAFTVNLAYNLEPVYSIAFAAVIFGEFKEVGPSFGLGIALIILSVLIQTRRVRKRALLGNLH